MSNSTATKRTCEVCGGALQASAKYGICSRTTLCWKLKGRRRRGGPIGGVRCSECDQPIQHDNLHGVCTTNLECRRALNRLRYLRERDQRLAYAKATRHKINARKRAWRSRNRCAHNGLRRALAARRGVLPRRLQRGHLSTNWRGGRLEYCSVPACDAPLGWKRPYEKKQLKYGFVCSAHLGFYNTEKNRENNRERRNQHQQALA